jgi:hypothetical protein
MIKFEINHIWKYVHNWKMFIHQTCSYKNNLFISWMKNVIKMFVLQKCSYKKNVTIENWSYLKNVFTWKKSLKKLVNVHKNVHVWNLFTKETCSIMKIVLKLFE